VVDVVDADVMARFELQQPDRAEAFFVVAVLDDEHWLSSAEVVVSEAFVTVPVVVVVFAFDTFVEQQALSFADAFSSPQGKA
jgi:hypothetical protein